MSSAKRAKRVITDYDVEFVSGVDDPAQVPATVRALKNKDQPAMKTVEQLTAEVSDLEKSLKNARAQAALTDAEKAYQRSLDGDERPVFAAKSLADRQAEMKAREAADPVVYEAKSGAMKGRKFRQSEADLVSMAQALDEQSIVNAGVVEAARKSRVEVRVKEFKNLSNDKGGLQTVLEVIDALPDGDSKVAALKMLEAANVAANKMSGPTGDAGATPKPEAEAAKAAYDAAVEKFRAAKNLSATEAASRAPLEDKDAIKALKALRAITK